MRHALTADSRMSNSINVQALVASCVPQTEGWCAMSDVDQRSRGAVGRKDN